MDNNIQQQSPEKEYFEPGSFADLFEQVYGDIQVKTGDIVKGTVVGLEKDHVVLSLGLKSDVYIHRKQFKDEEGNLEVDIGDEVEVCLQAIENSYGETCASREMAKRAETWVELEKAYEDDQPIKGFVAEKVKGGFSVEIGPIKAFLPGSLVSVRPARLADIEGQTVELKIVKINRQRSNIVVSRRAILEKENNVDREKLLASLQEGQEIEGTVKNLTPYGAFVGLGSGIDALLHLIDISWQRLKDPRDVLTEDQKIRVKILKIDHERGRISLGMKQLQEDPWYEVISMYPIGSRARGKVTNLTEYGCFVELAEGVEGLVHVSQMDWSSKNISPSKIVQVGDEVNVEILGIDVERRRISLGIKQCRENPWQAFFENHQIGDRLRGTVKSITEFGVFVGLEGHIDGLVHFSDLSWSEPGEKAIRQYQKGDEVDVVVLAIDVDRERISLGIKQLSSDLYEEFEKSHQSGDLMDGVVARVRRRKVVIALPGDVYGTLKYSELMRKSIHDATKIFNPDDQLRVKVGSCHAKNCSIVLLFEDANLETDESSVKKDAVHAPLPIEDPSLGDLIRQKLYVSHQKNEVEQEASVATTEQPDSSESAQQSVTEETVSEKQSETSPPQKQETLQNEDGVQQQQDDT